MTSFNIALQEEMMPALPRGTLVGNGRGVCRSLFGPIDHDELRSELKRQLKEIQANDCQRWNFDFETGTPLKGSFCWEPVDSKDIPSFYSDNRLCPGNTTQMPKQQPQSTLSSRQSVPAETREEAPAEIVRTHQSPVCAKENADQIIRRCQGVKGPTRSSSNSTSLLRKRDSTPAITDFFPKRKRTLVGAKAEGVKGAHPLCTLEQTPRKKIR
ncbi:cyclin-dependent kinase inhibitor 1B-like [Rhinophrynus dorsalis]